MDEARDSKYWTTQPKSFPEPEADSPTVAELNDFEPNNRDTTPVTKRSVKFADVSVEDDEEDDTIPTKWKHSQKLPETQPPETFMMRNNSRFWRARDSIFVHNQRRASEIEDDEESFFGENQDEQELTSGFENAGFQDYAQNWTGDQQDDDDDEGNSSENEDKPLWDTPKSEPLEDADASATSGWSTLFLKFLKLFTYGFTFCLVLFFAVVSKLSFHLIASMTRVNKTVTSCNQNLPGILEHDKHYHAWHGLLSPERIAWLWVLFFVMIAPEMYTFLRSIKVCLFKQYTMPKYWETFLIILTNVCEAVGLSLFAFVVLPSIDTISGLIFTNSVCLVPSGCLVLRTIQQEDVRSKQAQEEGTDSENDRKQSERQMTALRFYILAFTIQLIVLVSWPIILYLNDRNMTPQFGVEDVSRDEVFILMWALPLSGILISIGYWENFVPESGTGFMNTLAEIKKLAIVSKYAVYSFVSVLKIVIIFVMMLLTQSMLAYHYERKWSAVSEMIDKLFMEFSYAFDVHPIDLVRENSNLNDIRSTDSNPWTPILVGLVHAVSAFLCHRVVLFVCKIRIQPFSFAFPIHLVLPFSVSIMNLFVNFYVSDVCMFSNQYGPFEYMFWNVHYNLFVFEGVWNKVILALWLGSFIAKTITVSHVWIASKERLGSSDQLFVLPFYSSAIIEQSIMFSRRMDENLFSSVINRETSNSDELQEETVSLSEFAVGSATSDRIRVYACATVWHETSDELLMMLKSIMRMDQDQASRKLAVKVLDSPTSMVDYYDFQTHLFVDDAFIFSPLKKDQKPTDNDRLVNEYVEILIRVLDEAASNVHQINVKIPPPRIFITPYGGRVEWRLPGGTKMIAHLKDKLKIRHRKRWSQVMYMYYLLGFKIFEKCEDVAKRDELLKNTFILALDGDINFRPEAVLLLIDLMRKNKNLGAACGRIHPVGSGPMAWYQVFEYAISHWLQKATEHVFGCVLCSPGCFSLFRSYALVDTNVMNRYTTKPSEAIHYVQYDQGEDRWLCTLMLQQGWRVEYSAAADAYTHCPEGFGEFYIQRRRWGPSTMANIYDLLQNSKQTVKKNDNISSLYILYQSAMMFGTILSPGTIFLMLVGAMNTAFSMRTEISFYINFIPVLVFVIVCFTCETEFQLLVAQILSTFYAMLMLAVLVSTAIEIKEKTIFSPSVLFFVGMITVFVIAAVIHPQEFLCLMPLPVYMMTIPSMYLLLTIYSIINMNIVTWGTRENVQVEQPQEKTPEPVKNEKQGFLRDIGQFFTSTRSWGVNLLCCSTPKPDEELFYLHEIQKSVGKVNDEVIYLKAQMENQNRIARRMSIRPLLNEQSFDDEDEEDEQNENDASNKAKETVDQNTEDKSVQFDPKWLHQMQKIYKNSPVVEIKPTEKQFWVRFIEQYLKPLDEDKEHQKKVAEELIDLRNKIVFAFGIINIIFVLFVFLLQINKSYFSFQLRIDRGVNETYHDEESGKDIDIHNYTDVDLDPIGGVLIIFFGAILLLQFIGMFLHRFETITHLLAFTDMTFFKVREEDTNDMKTIQEHSVEIVKAYLENHPPKSDAFKYYDMIKYFLDCWTATGKRKASLQKITKGINMNRRASVALTLKKKQDRDIAQSNRMTRRYSVMIRNEIIREGETDDSDNEGSVSHSGSSYTSSDGMYRHESVSSNNSGSVRSGTGSGHSGQIPPSFGMNDIRNISSNFAEDIIQNALNVVDNDFGQQQHEAEIHNSDTHGHAFDSNHEENRHQSQLNRNSEEFELVNLDGPSTQHSSSLADEQVTAPKWAPANDFTSFLENTKL